MGYEYLMRHMDDWRRAGLVSRDHKMKRKLLVGLYLHFVGQTLKDVKEVYPPPILIIHGANNAGGELGSN